MHELKWPSKVMLSYFDEKEYTTGVIQGNLELPLPLKSLDSQQTQKQ